MRAKCYMLASMSNELQKQHENMLSASEILLHLQEFYGEHSRNARHEISRQLFYNTLTVAIPYILLFW